jgi:hypothetical protein
MASMKILPTLALLLMQQVPSANQATYTCRITVIDSEGTEIGKTHLFVHRDPAATNQVPDRTLETDPHGKIAIKLPSGFYDVCAMASAFTPVCRKVVLREHDADIKFQLSASPEVLEQIGDKF